MSNILFIDDPDDPYIHQITEKIQNIDIDEYDEIPADCVPDEEYKYTVLSIDIGILNLGLSVGLVDKEHNIVEIAWVDNIDITNYTHERELGECECHLYHTKSIADWMEHIFEEHKMLFESATYILIERQPITGLTSVEQLIYYRWRSKCILVHPRSMHKHFHIGHYEYEQRKERTMQIADKNYYWHPRAVERYETFERQHDISDSICLMGFWVHRQHEAYLDVQRLERSRNTTICKTLTTEEWFNRFKYKPNN